MRLSSARHDPFVQALARVEKRLPSFISDHGGECCRAARTWFRCLSVAAASRNPGPPTWIRERWEWGPSEWPLHWCQIPGLKTLDCGALACLARTALGHTGAIVLPVQLLEGFDTSAVEQWRAVWESCPAAAPSWTWESIAYHEAAAILDNGRLSIWDPTDSHFVEATPKQGYASVLAVRITSEPSARESAGRGTADAPQWNGRSVAFNRWVHIRTLEETPSRKRDSASLALAIPIPQ